MRLLDLFCGAGGAAWGYHLAGFDEIVGIDLAPQPHYPFTFVQADALEYLADHGHEYDFIHASPPCQGYSVMRFLPWLREKEYPMLIDPVRELLQASGRPWVVENVIGAKLDANWLCGGMFDLPFYRHRYFESSFLWFQPEHPPHVHIVKNGRMMGARARKIVHSGGIARWQASNVAQKRGCGIGHLAGITLVREAMQIDWMSRDEITQAVPPAYTRYVGEQWLYQCKE